MHVLVLGSGQLARMMSLAGAPLNIQISAYDVGSGNVVHPLNRCLVMVWKMPLNKWMRSPQNSNIFLTMYSTSVN